METVNEGTTSYVTATFKNKSGTPEAPASATWQAIDLESGTVLQSETAISPAGSVEITVPPAVNQIVDASHAGETRRIIVKAIYNASDKVNAQYDYRVVNLSGVT